MMLVRFMKGIFNLRPPLCRYTFTWDVGKVLRCLSTLYPLGTLSLKLLTLKCVSLVALATAQRSQTLAALDLKLLHENEDSLVFRISSLLKTTTPKHTNNLVILNKYKKPELCPVLTLTHYISRTKNFRKNTKLFISFKTYKNITSSTIAIWLKMILDNSGIDTSRFKAHSFRSASCSAAKKAGVSLKDILKTADWSSAKTSQKFYYKEIESCSSWIYTQTLFNSFSQSTRQETDVNQAVEPVNLG